MISALTLPVTILSPHDDSSTIWNAGCECSETIRLPADLETNSELACEAIAFRRYAVFYVVIEDHVEIARIIHGSRDLRRALTAR